MWIDDEGYLLYDRQDIIFEDSQGRMLRYGDRMEDAPLYTLETDGSGIVTAGMHGVGGRLGGGRRGAAH